MRFLATLIILLTLATADRAEGQFAVPLSDTQSGTSPTLAPLVKRVAPGVVSITVKGRIAEQAPILIDPSSGFPDAPYMSTDRKVVGAGVIVDARNGLIVTNNHVIERADEISVTLADERQIRATRVGVDPCADIAVIRIDATDLVALSLGDSDKLEVGDYVVAIGNPLGLGQTVTHGIVSALHRKGLRIEGYQDFVQTDAPINQGNSGGALVSLRGELVGINTAIVSPSGRNFGIGFAIPANMVRKVLNQMAKSW